MKRFLSSVACSNHHPHHHHVVALAFDEAVSSFIPNRRIIRDIVGRYAHGTDASCYRLTPGLVVKIESEEEIRRLVPLAVQHQVPITFRAAGTSLSGQALTDSVLVKLGMNWNRVQVIEGGNAIVLQPGVIGGRANAALASYGRKIGPDPSSIESCMVGGIVSNNSSGMCCGVKQNTYNTMRNLRIVFTDGSVLDTGSEESIAKWKRDHPGFIDRVLELREQVVSNKELVARIQSKFAIKCTTGYSLNAFVDFSDPIDIISHLIIGSEGTLAFISNVTLNTVIDHKHKQSAMMCFDTVDDACNATMALRGADCVDAVEIMDRSCIDSGLGKKGFEIFENLPQSAAALLVECRGESAEELRHRTSLSLQTVNKSKTRIFEPSLRFSADSEECDVWWRFRRGLLPLVGALREDGTTALIEDVACPIGNLAHMTVDLRAILENYGYAARESVILGHALEGNLHISIAQSFETAEQVKRYDGLMHDMMDCVTLKHNGSCKAEHGTGRNVSPWVEQEWGSDAYKLMWNVKRLFDPDMVLSPGVVLNNDRNAHLLHLKKIPVADPIVDKCTECGFCESNCPSLHLSLSPRQRIAVTRELARLERTGEDPERKKEMEEQFQYLGRDTCAADGMCSVKCPFGINTGEMIKKQRERLLAQQAAQQTSLLASLPDRFAGFAANNFALMTGVAGVVLNTVHWSRSILPDPFLLLASNALRAVSSAVPQWNPWIPKAAPALRPPQSPPLSPTAKVVYFPTCVTRTLGGGGTAVANNCTVHEAMHSLMDKANIEFVYPRNVNNLCCGMVFDSRGVRGLGAEKMKEAQGALKEASDNGRLPIVLDTSPCAMRLKEKLTDRKIANAIIDQPVFIQNMVLPNVEITKRRAAAMVHVPCSAKQMGLAPRVTDVVGACYDKVVSSEVPCCGMAGDRGLRFPELPAASLHQLHSRCCKEEVVDGVSSSRTCEIALSQHADMQFRSLAQLVDECATKPLQRQQATAKM